MRADFLITCDPAAFNLFNGVKIKYTNEATANDHLTIGNYGLLFENDIAEQDIHCFEENKYKAFFKTENADISFDILSASFYLLSRYEEYLPHKKDMYGRYAFENSLASRENFLHQPLINIWVRHLAELLVKRSPGFILHHTPFTFMLTYDIDMAFSYNQKGFRRNIAGFFRAPSYKRVKVLLGLEKDPFDSYDWLNDLHSRHSLQPLYFFLLAEKNGRYDKNIKPGKKVMGRMIQEHAKKYTLGIHPSWQSVDKPALLSKEKQLMEVIIGAAVTKSRQHYIRFNLPAGYRQLLDAGLTDDYSMGYGSINGFRASAASSFYWYDLQRNVPTLLRVHPFCFMDANSFYEQKYTAADAYGEMMHYFRICKEVSGQLITIWHNNFLGTDEQFAGWREIYKRFITQLKKPADH